jgi:hypothetical protein
MAVSASYPGVDFACCGHGDPLYAYVKGPDIDLREAEAIAYFRE